MAFAMAIVALVAASDFIRRHMGEVSEISEVQLAAADRARFQFTDHFLTRGSRADIRLCGFQIRLQLSIRIFIKVDHISPSIAAWPIPSLTQLFGVRTSEL